MHTLKKTRLPTQIKKIEQTKATCFNAFINKP